jgi:hypothetical protein
MLLWSKQAGPSFPSGSGAIAQVGKSSICHHPLLLNYPYLGLDDYTFFVVRPSHLVLVVYYTRVRWWVVPYGACSVYLLY